MPLSGIEVKQLQQALTDTFLTRGTLSQGVLLQLNLPPNILAGVGSPDDIAFKLIQWAEDSGQMPTLIKAALAQNPNNPILQSVISSHFHDNICLTENVLSCDQVGGDKVGGDKITTGDISGTAIAVGKEIQQTVNINHYYSDYQAITSDQDGANLLQRRLRLTVHIAYFLYNGAECCFINATNLSLRDVEITHIWFECEPQIHVFQRDRPLPKRLKPDETWETWLRVDRLPSHIYQNPHKLARARLSTGKIIESQKNDNVPPQGLVPGGPITKI